MVVANLRDTVIWVTDLQPIAPIAPCIIAIWILIIAKSKITLSGFVLRRKPAILRELAHAIIGSANPHVKSVREWTCECWVKGNFEFKITDIRHRIFPGNTLGCPAIHL